MDPSAQQTQPFAVVLYDGDCNLCHWILRFIVRRDPRARFGFAPLQLPVARQALGEHDSTQALQSVVLLAGGRSHLRSGAVLRIMARLRWPWPLLAGLLLIPWPLRDLCYRWVAAGRLRWFGRRPASCAVEQDVRTRLLDEAKLQDWLAGRRMAARQGH